jgi:hypothetical protein
MNGENWWSISERYNNAIFPVQIVIMVIGVILTYFSFAKPNTRTNNLMNAYLAFTFAWNGIVFFLIFGKELPGTFLGAPLFIIIPVLFAVDIFTKKTEFKLPNARWHKYSTIFWVLCAFLYPLIGLPLGHRYPRSCMFGVFPCPTTVFALALLVAAIPKVDKKVYILLLIWAIPSVGKCFGVLDLYEDCVLFVAGVYGLIMLVKNWKVIGKDGKEKSF